jgi:hypothetical protein
VTIPGGAAWKTGTRRWIYRDPLGAAGGIVKAVVQDRRNRVPGMVRVVLKGRSDAPLVLPDVAAVRTTLVVGAPAECASVTWGGPTAASPRCRGDGTRLACK